jgi:quinol monooxygenase YgiN
MKNLAWGLLVSMGIAACGDDTGGGGGGGGGGDDATTASGSTTTGDASTTTAASTSASSSSGGNAYEDLFLCEETDFEDDFPLSGPGFDPETGIVGEPQETYLVATTQIYARPEKAAEFMQAAGAVLQTLGQSEGMLAWGIGSSETCGDSRTISIWASEEAMLGFVASDAHAAAMIQSPDLAFTGRTTHWEATAEELMELDWDVARDRLKDIPGFY